MGQLRVLPGLPPPGEACAPPSLSFSPLSSLSLSLCASAQWFGELLGPMLLLLLLLLLLRLLRLLLGLLGLLLGLLRLLLLWPLLLRVMPPWVLCPVYPGRLHPPVHPRVQGLLVVLPRVVLSMLRRSWVLLLKQGVLLLSSWVLLLKQGCCVGRSCK